MTNQPPDPPRLLDDPDQVPAELRELLRGGRGVGPRPHELASLRARLGTALMPPAARTTPRPAAGQPSTPALVSGAKLLVAVAVTGSLVTGGVWIGRRRPHSAPTVSATLAHPPAQSSGSTNVAPEEPAAVREVEFSPPAPGSRARRRAELPTKPPGAVATSRPSLQSVAGSSTPPSPAQSAAKRDEAELLERAQRALPSDPAAALALADVHRARYTAGALVQEREMIAISALVRLDRSTEAIARARAFESRYPASAYTRRLRGLLDAAGR